MFNDPASPRRLPRGGHHVRDARGGDPDFFAATRTGAGPAGRFVLHLQLSAALTAEDDGHENLSNRGSVLGAGSG